MTLFTKTMTVEIAAILHQGGTHGEYGFSGTYAATGTLELEWEEACPLPTTASFCGRKFAVEKVARGGVRHLNSNHEVEVDLDGVIVWIDPQPDGASSDEFEELGFFLELPNSLAVGLQHLRNFADHEQDILR